MESRYLRKINTKIGADVVINRNCYKGSIENISEEGIFEIAFYEIDIDALGSQKILRVTLRNPPGEDLEVQCKITWLRFRKDDPDRLTCCVGMEIVSPLAGYMEFIKTIS